MPMPLPRTLIVAALLLALPAAAATVYKTVDRDGRVTYSDQPPPQGEPAAKIEIRDFPTGRSASEMERLQQMRETTDRMREDRLARERERAIPPAAVQPPYDAPDDGRQDRADDDDDTVYYPYPYHPYRRHPHPYPPYPDDARPQPQPGSRGPGGLLGKIRDQY